MEKWSTWVKGNSAQMWFPKCDYIQSKQLHLYMVNISRATETKPVQAQLLFTWQLEPSAQNQMLVEVVR